MSIFKLIARSRTNRQTDCSPSSAAPGDFHRADLAAMPVEELLDEAKACGLTLQADGERLRIRGPKNSDHDLIQALLLRKAEIIPLSHVDLATSALPAADTSMPSVDKPPVQMRPASELESILTGIEAEARRLTSDPKLLQAVHNLMTDCREFWSEGKYDVAMVNATTLATSIPKYLSEAMVVRRRL